MNLKQTKQKLTYFFVIVVFFLILLIGIGFLGGKFLTEKSKDEEHLARVTYTLEQRDVSEKQLKNILQGPRSFPRRGMSKPKPLKKEERFGKVEYLSLAKDGSIQDFHILGYEEDGIFYEIAENRERKQMYMQNGYLVKNIQTTTGQFAFFLKMKYPFSTLVVDTLRFLLLNILFCTVIYFIGKQFTTKVFKPVEENIDDMKNFVHNAGHELKTPITVMDSNLQLIMSMKKYDAEMFQEMKTELKNMNGLIDGLLSLSDISSIKNAQKNSLGEKIEDIIKQFSSDISQKDIKVQTNIPENIDIEANENYFSILLSNLIKNAIKYNKQDGSIDISYEQKVLTISDTGIGIDAKNLPKIFDRFYREEEARSKNGFGIGLSLVKKIADMYGWKIEVESEKGEGTKVKVRF